MGRRREDLFLSPRHRRSNVQAEAFPPPLPGGYRPRCPRGSRVHRILGHDGRAAAPGGRSPIGCLYSCGPKSVSLPLAYPCLPHPPYFSFSIINAHSLCTFRAAMVLQMRLNPSPHSDLILSLESLPPCEKKDGTARHLFPHSRLRDFCSRTSGKHKR